MQLTNRQLIVITVASKAIMLVAISEIAEPQLFTKPVFICTLLHAQFNAIKQFSIHVYLKI